MDINKLIKLLEIGENEHIEFKESKKSLPKSFWETFSAFSNSQGGGLIFLGVDNDGNIIGVEDIKKVKDDLFNCLRDKNKINYSNFSERYCDQIRIDSKDILLLRVEEVLDRNKPVYIDNNIHKTYIRIGSGDRKVTDDELKIMLFNAKIQTDDILLYEYTLDDLDEETISNFKDEVNTQYPEKNYNQLETEDFLKSIGALRKDRTNPSNGYKINLGALLFFGKYQSIKDFIPHYFLNILT